MLAVVENPIFRAPAEQAQAQLRRRTTLVRRSAKRKMIAGLQSRNAVAEIEQLPATNESLHIVCRGNFPLWSIVPAVLRMSEAIIQDMAIATLGFSTSNASDLIGMLDGGQVRRVTALASVYFERQNPAEWGIMHDGLKARGQTIAALRSHAKVIAMKLSDGRCYAIESSANLRSCRNIEQICITESAELYAFHSEWIKKVCASKN